MCAFAEKVTSLVQASVYLYVFSVAVFVGCPSVVIEIQAGLSRQPPFIIETGGSWDLVVRDLPWLHTECITAVESCEGIDFNPFAVFFLVVKLQRNFQLTLADFFVCHVVPSREAVFGHGHVGVEGQWENPCRRVDLRRDPGPAVSSNQGTHCKIKNLTLKTKTLYVNLLWYHLFIFLVFIRQFQTKNLYLLFQAALRKIWASGSRTLSHIFYRGWRLNRWPLRVITITTVLQVLRVRKQKSRVKVSWAHGAERGL